MASSIASEMAKAVNTLGDGFKTFYTSTITETVWNGEAAENAKKQVTSKIDPKVEELTTKLNNLQQALDLSENAKIAKGNMEEYEKALNSLDPNADNYFSKKREYKQGHKEEERKYNDYIEKIRKLCNS